MKLRAFLFSLASLAPGLAQESAPANTPPAVTVEPGLEEAVKWRWLPEATDEAAWGFAIEVKKADVAVPAGATVPATSPDGKTPVPAPAQPVRAAPAQAVEHVVARGETLSRIANRYYVTVDHIKKFNSLTSDRILLGQKLRIPGVDDIKAMTPPPPTIAVKEPAKAAEPKSEPPPPPARSKADSTTSLVIATKPRRAIPSLAWGIASLVRTQVYLDRAGFTLGPIDGTAGPSYNTAFEAFTVARPGELFTSNGQPTAALQSIGGAFIEYTLREEDLRWIAPSTTPATTTRRGAAAEPPPVTFDSLTSPSFLAYRSAWEFVAERFHASESFLRRINPGLRNAESPGAVFLVPNVEAFEIENVMRDPKRPAVDAAAPVKARMVNLKRLIIQRGDQVIANMPVSVARPGLRGRGTWLVLESVLRPRLVSTGPESAPFPTPVTLPAGPNNPAGIAWLQLAKATDPKPLPYGLHGTSIPGYMFKQESVGGFRMTNWDLARVMKLLPVGTELNWE